MSKRQTPSTDLLICKRRKTVAKVGLLYLKSLENPFICSSTNSPFNLFCLRSDRLYTVGRKHRYCNFVFDDPRVSKRHCQIFLDALDRRIFVLDGFFSPTSSNPNEIRSRFQFEDTPKEGFQVRPSLNGVFVNGFRIGEGKFKELFTGDEVQFVCANELDLSFNVRIGFVVERVIFTEEVVQPSVGDSNVSKARFQGGQEVGKGKLLSTSVYNDLSSRAVFLLKKCRKILHCADTSFHRQGCLGLKAGMEILRIEIGCPAVADRRLNKIPCSTPPSEVQRIVRVETTSKVLKLDLFKDCRKTNFPPEAKSASTCNHNDTPQNKIETSVPNAYENSGDSGLLLNQADKVNQSDSGLHGKEDEHIKFSPGKKFYLNRLNVKGDKFVDDHMSVSLPELLHPVGSLSRMFIATFTSDIYWFLSYCKVPNNLPVTIACHNTERCWSSNPDKRISHPYEDFPNVVVIYPPFPDIIAFGQDRKKQGIACHHPKLFVLQRDDSIRVVVSSANLNSKQWNDVTNTVWWQDFPLRTVPDYSSLFTSTDEESFQGIKSDFAAQLAGFMASLIVDIPSQANWITELTQYEFRGANGHLVASVPGMHRHRAPYPLGSTHFLSANHCASQLIGMKFLGYVETSLVGLKHRFHTAADSNGAALKTLAAFLGKCQENTFGMAEVVLRRNHNIPADANAVSVLICDLDEFSEGDFIQLGFLPRNTAQWVASLCDAGFFSFSAYIYPKEVLAAALEESNNKVQLILYVSQGPCFSKISSLLQPEHIVSISSLIASLQRCVGLSRLHEVLGQYKWPESLETDFFYGSSSIGTSVNSQFLAAFSSASGKRSIQFSESEESDPEWGRWNANEELKRPSMRIIFPTIERVRNSSCGIWPSRRLLCLSEGTWQRLKSVNIFHDAVPYPSCRIGYPMHTKVAGRRFQSKTDAFSFGWVYCGSHNFSAAAWGQPTSSSGSKFVPAETNFFLGSRLHISNYELGIIFIVPPKDSSLDSSLSIDDITLPFVMPAPRYKSNDRPATAKAMREAVAELAQQEKEVIDQQELVEVMMDDIPEEEMIEVSEYIVEEREEEKAYAETLWSQVDSAEN